MVLIHNIKTLLQLRTSSEKVVPFLLPQKLLAVRYPRFTGMYGGDGVRIPNFPVCVD